MSLRRIHGSRRPWTARALVADDTLEFHAARLLLLLRHCGVKGEIQGLTKLAKLDFFVRYPEFFERVAGQSTPAEVGLGRSESSMVRHHYGPWDHRYYQVLGFLEANGLTATTPSDRGYSIRLKPAGVTIATALTRDTPFGPLVAHMKRVKQSLGRKSGATLKRMIYDQFQEEVAELRLGAII